MRIRIRIKPRELAATGAMAIGATATPFLLTVQAPSRAATIVADPVPMTYVTAGSMEFEPGVHHAATALPPPRPKAEPRPFRVPNGAASLPAVPELPEPFEVPGAEAGATLSPLSPAPALPSGPYTISVLRPRSLGRTGKGSLTVFANEIEFESKGDKARMMVASIERTVDGFQITGNATIARLKLRLYSPKDAIHLAELLSIRRQNAPSPTTAGHRKSAVWRVQWD